MNRALNLLHTDPASREALKETLKQIWPELCFDTTPDALILDMAHIETPVRLSALINRIARLMDEHKPQKILFTDGILWLQQREWHKNDGTVIEITEKETDLLLYLFDRQEPVTRDELLQYVWGYAANTETHTIETHIHRLRQKIEPIPEAPRNLVTTKEGYALEARSIA